MKTLNEKVVEIIESNDFNDLPIEERKRIVKYLGIMQILTLWQVLKQYGDVVTPAWRKKTRSWLESCVKYYQEQYGEVDKE